MRRLYFIDGALWLVNGLLWASYAHVPSMAIFSAIAAVVCFGVARHAE